MDFKTRKKGHEVVEDEDDDVGSNRCVLHSTHFNKVMFNACVLSEGVCWRISTLHSYVSLSQFRIDQRY